MLVRRTFAQHARSSQQEPAEARGGAALREASDEALMERFRDGEARAFEEILRRHGTPLYNFVLRYTKNTAVAEDIVQDVFARVVRNASGWEQRSKLSTWLYTIARNACIDAARRASHRNHPSLDQPMGADPEGRALGETVATDNPGGDRGAMDTEFRGALDKALAALPDEQREVFLMREVHHLPFKEIADITQVPVNTVKSRMRYALEGLRLHLAEFSPG
jgi:RNA polymerase sigma-70 factor (ECF subfamily)